LFLFPLWGILHPHTYRLADLLPLIALGWLGLGAIAASVLRARRPASFEVLGRVFAPGSNHPRMGDDITGPLKQDLAQQAERSQPRLGELGMGGQE
jgi:hypothetical protein